MQYSLSNSGPITAIRGRSGSNTIIATLSTGTGQPVTLSCVSSSLPPAASCSLNPTTITPTSPTGSSSILTITTTTSTPGGSSTIIVTCTPQPTGNTTSALAVAHFEINRNPPSVSLPQGRNRKSIIIL